MSFAADYIGQLDAFAVGRSLPRVRALHLPPPGPTPSDGRGQFCAVELEDGSIGQSYVLLDDTLDRLRHGIGAAGLVGAESLQLARAYRDGQGIARIVGFAAANALTRCLFDRAAYRPPDSGDSIGRIAPEPGDHIGMIGLFKPLLGRVLGSGARLTVLELQPELAGVADGYLVTLDADALGTCNKVMATGTVLLNETFDEILKACRAARWFALIGPSAGCLPDALFARGVTLLGGSWVEDGKAFVDALRNGESPGSSVRKFAIDATEYPGTEVLVRRI